eukprot:CAMPEP_0183790372 /NCGR_PEP_ID=MMETSP0803_2-20130417/1000_1 /TAXON_ID=195967 /ORGANISM="Crustomastix stigmata, Strain CCMP3273" /LENGTH=243 /DNA_ID=CAMNT_0026034587 /DNA_START=40 /DNA_END=771 /DNA_ORIENTATION=-
MATVLRSLPRATSSLRRTRATRGAVQVSASSRPMWFPGAEAPAHLDGSMMGDYGFDPLRLGMSDALPYYREAELMNGRWAMAATAGILFTDALNIGPGWVEAGTMDTALDTPTLLGIELVIMAAFEYKRIEGFKKTGGCGVLNSFPFDPLGQKSPETELKELKNGRLAMISFLGYASQYAVTGMGPIACLKAHIADPYNNNIYTSAVGPEVVVAIAASCLAPMFIVAQKQWGGKESGFRPIPW